MNQLKKRIPIWKKEIWTDGQAAWIHPGLAEVDPSCRDMGLSLSEDNASTNETKHDD
jgi:hypothetical protein